MNMRKIIAVLAAVLMLFTVIPMGALSVTAATGDVAVDWNFDDGVAHFERGTAENGYMVFDATTADWQCAYQYIGTINSDTTYKVTFKAMANKDAELTFKIQNDWAATNVKETVNVTTEWQEYELIVNSGTVNPPIVLFSSGYAAANAPIYYIDDLKIVEIVDPALIGKVVNGDFSSEEGWTLGTGATIADGVLTLNNPALWSEAALQTVPVKANTNYEITWDSQRVSGTGAFNLFTLDGNNANLTKVAGQNWMNETSGNWVSNSYTVNTGASEVIKLKLSTEASNPGEILIDNFKITELKDPSFDGYIYNGDFETGKKSPWNLYQSTVISADAAHTGDYGVHIVGVGNWGGLLEQDISGLVVDTEYIFSFWMKMNHQGVNVKIGDSYVGWFTSVGDWTLITHKFTATATTAKILINGGGTGDANPDLAADLYVDDFSIAEAIEPSDDGYIVNGNFEAGSLSPWQKIWDTQVAASIIDDGHDSPFGAKVTGKAPWGQLRQLINVESNTDYKVTLWAKDVNNMSLLIKDGGDTVNILNAGINAGADWTEITAEFNSGDYSSVYLGVMVNDAASYGTFDDFKIEKAHVCEFVGVETLAPTCTEPGIMTYSCTCGEGTYTEVIPAAHTYTDNCDAECDVCGEFRDAPHNLTTHVEAVVPANCQETGYPEHWICADCGGYFRDNGAGGFYETNPAWISYTGEHVRPEGAAVCAVVACELCGEDSYGEPCTRPEGAPQCTDVACVNCGETITGWGHNYNTGDEEIPLPLCGEGDCIYCGEHFDKLYDHENGAWAPCLDGECAYGCGLAFPATADHVDEDADGFCDVCWNEMPEEPPVEVVYGDADGDGEVTSLDVLVLQQYFAGYDVTTLNETAADADGDGEVTSLDVLVLQQYFAGWDVTLGPV